MTTDRVANEGKRFEWLRATGPLVVVCAFLFVAMPTSANAQLLKDEVPDAARGLTVEEKLGERLPRGLTFTDHNGETFALDRLFTGEKPVVFAFVYFDCPIVCSVVLDRVQQGIRGIDYTVGEDFNLLVVSFDHTEGASESSSRRILDVTGYDRSTEPGVSDGFVYLTGSAGNLKALSDATGFQYRLLENGEYSHPVGIMVLSPDGVVTRYLYGFDYPAKDLRLSLLEATEGKIAQSLGEALEFYCFRYDPTAGAYSVEAMAVMRLAGGATVVALTIFIGVMFLGERARRRAAGPGSTPLDSEHSHSAARAAIAGGPTS